jgi:hypothetical protein
MGSYLLIFVIFKLIKEHFVLGKILIPNLEEWVTRRYNLIYRLNQDSFETICLTPSALTPKFVTGLVKEALYPSDEE